VIDPILVDGVELPPLDGGIDELTRETGENEPVRVPTNESVRVPTNEPGTIGSTCDVTMTRCC